MAYAELAGDRVNIITDWSEGDLVKQVSGARWDSDRRVWWAPLSWATCVTLRGVFGERLRVGENLDAWAWTERNARVDPANRLRELTVLPGDDDTKIFEVIKSWR